MNDQTRYINGVKVEIHDLDLRTALLTLEDGTILSQYERDGEYVITGTIYGENSLNLVKQAFPNLKTRPDVVDGKWIAG